METFDETAGRFAVHKTTVHEMHVQAFKRVELKTKKCSENHYKRFGVSNFDVL